MPPISHDIEVSIVIPSYNYGHLIKDTLDNLLLQDYCHWEAIIVDDGSSDNTKDIVNEFCKKDSRFIYIYKENGGLASARNLGISLARGTYIQFLDADDCLSQRKINAQVAYMNANSTCAISYTDAKYFPHGNPQSLYNNLDLNFANWMPKSSGQGSSLIREFIQKNLFPVNSALVRVCFIKENQIQFKTEMKYLEDWDFWIRCCLNDALFQHINDVKAYAMIRVHPASMSKNSFQMAYYELELMKFLESEIYSRNIDNSELFKLIKKKREKVFRRVLRMRGYTNLKVIKEIIVRLGFFGLMRVYIKELNYIRKNNNSQ